jgi:hypothetical protein
MRLSLQGRFYNKLALLGCRLQSWGWKLQTFGNRKAAERAVLEAERASGPELRRAKALLTTSLASRAADRPKTLTEARALLASNQETLHACITGERATANTEDMSEEAILRRRKDQEALVERLRLEIGEPPSQKARDGAL